MFKYMCVYFTFQKSLGLRVYPGSLCVCVVFLRQMSLLPVLWVGWAGVRFKPETEQVLHWQYLTAELLVKVVLHLCSMFSTGWKLGELIFAWNILWKCSLRTVKEWCLQLWSRCYYIVPCSLALILKTWRRWKVLEYAVKIKCWFMVTLSVGTFQVSHFASLLSCCCAPWAPWSRSN